MTSMVSRTCLLIGSLKIPTISKQTLKCLEKMLKDLDLCHFFSMLLSPQENHLQRLLRQKKESKVSKNNLEKSRKELKSKGGG